MFVIFLSNRLHPDGSGDVTPLRARVATVVASSLTDVAAETLAQTAWTRQSFASQTPAVPAPPAPPVLAGIDVLRAEGFKALAGKRVALLTNHTGRDRDGTATIDLLANASNVKLVSLFSPEHGIRGLLDASVPSTTDEKTRLPIHSLYGATRRPTAEMLTGVEAIVIDLQDIGTRFYTYMTSMAYVLEEAAARKIAVVVLDRPNPIGGVQIEGPSLDESAVGFTGYLPAMPIRHGMTMGELARLFNAEKKINADLTVVAMKNWRRDAWFDETGLTWIGPSPNMRNLHQADAVSGDRRVRVHEHLGGTRHRHAVRARRRAVDRRRTAGGGVERAPDSRRAFLSRALHAGRPASSPTRSAEASSWSSPTAPRSARCGSASSSPRLCSSCSPASSKSTRPRGCSARRRDWRD